MSLSLNVPILTAESLHCLVRRSLKKFDLKCGAQSGAALNRVNTVFVFYNKKKTPELNR